MDHEDSQHGYCIPHVVRGAVGGAVICSNHRESTTIGAAFVCPDHYEPCTTCTVAYSTDELTAGQCSAGRSIGDSR